MNSVLRYCICLALLIGVVGCSQQADQRKSNLRTAPVKAASLPGDLTYQDVLQEGEVVNGVAMSPDAQRIWVGTHAGLYSSVNDGLWGLLSPDLEANDIVGWFIDPEDPERIVAAGSSGIQRSTDGGRNWESIGAGLPTKATIHSFSGIREGNSVRLFAFATGEGIYQSTDGGERWELWLPLDQEVYAIDFNSIENRLYVATQYGLIYYQNNSWETENVPNVEQIYSLSINKLDGTIYIATEQGIMEKSSGEWRLLETNAPEKLIVIASGTGDTELVGVGESAFIYTLSEAKWTKWN